MADTLDISLDDGKYRVVRSDTEFKALRYDEPWRDLTGDNLVLMFTYEIESLRARLAEANEREANARCTHCGGVFFETDLSKHHVECQVRVAELERKVELYKAITSGYEHERVEAVLQAELRQATPKYKGDE